MEIDGGDGADRRDLPKEARPIFSEGIRLTLSRWAALQMAVDLEWGGRNTRLRAEQLVDEVFDWFTQSRELYVDDLEDLLIKFMLTLNTEIDDGSIEEVAEKLMILHEECLECNYTSVQNLSAQPRPAISHVRQKLNDDEDNSSDDEGGEMQAVGHRSSMMEKEKSLPNSRPADMSVDKPIAEKTAEAEDKDGWTTVSSSRKKKGSRQRN